MMRALPTDRGYGAKLAGPFSSRHEKALVNIAKLSATTLKGLQAKARVVPIVIHNAAESPDEREEKFFRSFAADVEKLLETIIDERRQAARKEVQS
jgi:hypothetical protein